MVLPKKFLSLFLAIFLVFPFFFFAPSAWAIGNPVKISTSSDDTIFPQTVTDNNGYLHMVWQELTPGQIWTGLNPGIFYSRWNGDIWSTPLKISENTGFAEIPSLAVDANNTLHLTWDDETYGEGISKVAYKTRTAGGTWSAIETIPSPAGTGFNWNSSVAIDGTGTPHVAFTANTGGTQDSIYWTRRVAGSWTTPELVSLDTAGNPITYGGQWVMLRQDNAGNIHIIYSPWGQGVYYRKYSGGTWTAPLQVTTAGDIGLARMAVTPAGEVFITWHQSSDDSVRVRWTQGGVWQSETTLVAPAERSFWGFPIMGVTTDSKERAHVGWGEKDVDGLIDLKYRSFQSGIWGSAQDVDLNNNDADTPYVYPDKWDNQHFAWAEKNPTTGIWEVYYRVAEGTVQTVGTGGGTITVNPGGVTYATLQIPSSALSSNTEIGILIGPVPENVDPTQVTIPRAFTFRPNGLVFNGTATATFFYTDSEIGGADERQLRPWVWNSQTNAWEARTGSVNRAQNRIAVDLAGFSLFGISAPIVKTTWLSPTPGLSLKQAAYLFDFKLAYADGNEIVAPATADELTVKVKDAAGNVKKTIRFEPAGIIQDQGKKIYKGNLFFQRDNYANGVYTIEVYLADSLVGTQTFTLAR